MTVEELLTDKVFLSLWENEIDKIHNDRKLRPFPKEGYYYKRNFYDRMSEKSQINLEFFNRNILLILIKKSNLSSEIRDVILYTYQMALVNYFKTINKNELCT